LSRTAEIDQTQPVRLIPVRIPKPWGQEIWYTGIEARGESQVATPVGPKPLSAYLKAVGLAEVLLLKILDPSPEPVLGDLYFEVHEKKREVYVVTHVAETGGRIRFGMNQDLREEYDDDAAFRAAYLAAVKQYEAIRRRLDSGQSLPDRLALEREEATLRGKMDAFTGLRRLAVGDVVVVPTFTPHALQHGVRVVEFQTPVYERLIVSFAQKVLTQNHWDTQQAVKHMHLDPPIPPVFEKVGHGIHRIAKFDDFNVWRINGRMAPNLKLPANLPYAVVMSLTNDSAAGQVKLNREEAALVPCKALDQPLNGEQYLVAAPNL
jgi:hypothetical protein